MFTIITSFSAFLSLLVAFFKDYLKVNKMWPRKHEQVVADSISVTALLIGMVNSIPYLLLVTFVYKDWLVTARTLSDIVRVFLTLLIAIGFWVHTNQGISIWTLFLRAINIGKRKPHYEIILVPQEDGHITKVKARYPNLSLTLRRGGQVFVVDNCNSLKKVKSISQQYQDLGLYVTYLEVAS
jgi:hypothetical protein